MPKKEGETEKKASRKTTEVKRKDESPSNKKTKSRSSIPRLLLITSTLVVLLAVGSMYICKTEQSCYGFGGVIKDVAHSNFFKYFRTFIKSHTSSSSSNSKSKNSQDTNEGEGEEGGKVSEQQWMKGPIKNSRILTLEEIKYVENGPLYLVIIGHVFDVSSGKDYYAPGTGYFGFIGQDGSRAFISGEFNEKGLIDDVEGLTHSDYLGLANWIKFYFDKYTFVGYLSGRFFDEKGQETEYMKKFKTWVGAAELNDEAEQDLRKLFPPCNAQWNAEDGSLLWCTNQSGGIKRDWIGFPRQFFENRDEKPRCACVHPNFLADGRVREYENCNPTSTSCRPPKDD